VVRWTGGLRDTVIDSDFDPEHGTGFAFGPIDSGALIEACARAISAMGDPARWRAIQQRAMSVDWSWDGPARQYESLYRRAIAIHGGT
jgi:starch synthase